MMNALRSSSTPEGRRGAHRHYNASCVLAAKFDQVSATTVLCYIRYFMGFRAQDDQRRCLLVLLDHPLLSPVEDGQPYDSQLRRTPGVSFWIQRSARDPPRWAGDLPLVFRLSLKPPFFTTRSDALPQDRPLALPCFRDSCSARVILAGSRCSDRSVERYRPAVNIVSLSVVVAEGCVGGMMLCPAQLLRSRRAVSINACDPANYRMACLTYPWAP